MSEQRLIDANRLIDFIDCGHLRNPLELCFSESEVVNMLDSAPTVPADDVAPVVHGRWVEAKVGGMSLYPDGQKMCSVCGQIMPSRWETMPPFCFGCGAKMDAKSEAGK